jgi:hypothetical protein
MSRAFKFYQTDYIPKQLMTGFRTSEARLLLVLGSGTASNKADLPRDIAMPMREVEQAATILKKDGLMVESDGFFKLTERARKQHIIYLILQTVIKMKFLKNTLNKKRKYLLKS